MRWKNQVTEIIVCVVIFLSATKCAQAADICQAIALEDVSALENSSSILKKGEIDESITQYRVDSKTGETSFCSHGGYCYPTHIKSNSGILEVLKLTNCKIADKPDPPITANDDEMIYEVEPIRSKIDPALLKFDDLDNKLLELGLCSACAGNVAKYYIEKPDSQCAMLARQALEGNPESLQTLQNFPEYCNWDSMSGSKTNADNMPNTTLRLAGLPKCDADGIKDEIDKTLKNGVASKIVNIELLDLTNITQLSETEHPKPIRYCKGIATLNAGTSDILYSFRYASTGDVIIEVHAVPNQ